MTSLFDQRNASPAAITPFIFERATIRTIQIDGQPWFVAADVCTALTVATEQTRRLDDDEKGLRTVQTPGGPQEMLIINESGLYSLILTSRKPSAKRFKRWVTGEVLPTIRKTGAYGIQAAPAVPQSLSAALRLAADQADLIEQQQAQLAIAAPKADALDRIAGATGSMTIREAAKDLQVKPLTFSNWLRANRWIYKQGRSNLAHQPRIDAGYMAHKVTLVEVEGYDGVTFEKPVTQARITPKGLAKLAVVFAGSAA